MGEQAEGILARLMRAYDVHDESALAIQMGRDMSTLRVWKTRDSVPLLVLTDAARATGYSLSWLRGDDDAPEREAGRTPDDDATRMALSPRELALIERYRATDEDRRAAAEQLMSALSDAKPPRKGKARGSNPSEVGAPPAVAGGVQLVMTAREGPAPWKVAEPVKADTSKPGGGARRGASALLPISSASESRPLVLSIKGGSAGLTKDYEVIPKYTARARAGSAVACSTADPDALDQAGDMAFSAAWLRENLGHTSGQLASIQVQGDSMAPTLLGGETIVIDTAVRRVDVSGIYVIDAHGDRLIKRIDRKLDKSLVIISDNPAYPPETVPATRLDDIRVIGRMVGRWQR